MRSTLMAVVFTCSLVACKGKEDKAAAPAPAATGAPASGGTAAAPAAPAAAKVDVCSFATKEQVETAVGSKLTGDPKPQATQGSLLGGCEYMTEAGMAMATLRPAHEYKPTVEASGETTEVPGLGEKAVSSPKLGLLVQPAGKPYFFHIMFAGGSGMDIPKATEFAKLMVAGAK